MCVMGRRRHLVGWCKRKKKRMTGFCPRPLFQVAIVYCSYPPPIPSSFHTTIPVYNPDSKNSILYLQRSSCFLGRSSYPGLVMPCLSLPVCWSPDLRSVYGFWILSDPAGLFALTYFNKAQAQTYTYILLFAFHSRIKNVCFVLFFGKNVHKLCWYFWNENI